MLDQGSAAAKDHDRRLTLHAAFEAQAACTPDATAICFESATLRHAEINARANRSAHVLMQMGVGPGSLVGLCTRRGPDLVIGAPAILKAAAYDLMDPAYPPDRLALYAEDSACAVIVTQSGLAAGLAVETLGVDSDGRLSGAPDTFPAAAAGPEDLAYMIYTSGSTGRPKGVRAEHRDRQPRGPGAGFVGPHRERAENELLALLMGQR